MEGIDEVHNLASLTNQVSELLRTILIRNKHRFHDKVRSVHQQRLRR